MIIKTIALAYYCLYSTGPKFEVHFMELTNTPHVHYFSTESCYVGNVTNCTYLGYTPILETQPEREISRSKK